jgi:hypothetical protein
MTNQTNDTNTRTRAPKGGITIMGVFYKGGQFLPQYAPKTDEEKTQSNGSARNKYLNSQIKQTNESTKLYRGDKLVTDKNGFTVIKRGLWYRLNIGGA